MPATILVLGARGMLGKAVVAAATEAGHLAIQQKHLDVTDAIQLMLARDQFGPDAVINCAGRVPERTRNELSAIMTNSIGPRNVARVFAKSHVVNVSTDCVFSGRRKAAYTTEDLPDPVDWYGRSKLLGECSEGVGNVTTVRTSFVGTTHGLVPWFLAHKPGDIVMGWSNAWWTGSTVSEVAAHLVAIADGGPMGLVHLATWPATTKYDVLLQLQRVFDRHDLLVEQCLTPRIYRNLKPTIELTPFASCARQLVEHAA